MSFFPLISKKLRVAGCLTAILLLAIIAVAVSVLFAKWSYGQEKLSPNGQYSASIQTYEYVVNAGRQTWARLEVHKVGDMRVIYSREVVLPDGFLVGGRPSRILWSSDSDSVALRVIHSSAEKSFQADISIDGNIQESWRVSK
jgi:hypothetical protein